MAQTSEEQLLKELEELRRCLSASRGLASFLNPALEIEGYKSTIEKKVSSGFALLLQEYQESLKKGGESLDFFDGRSIDPSYSMDESTLEKLYCLITPAFERGEYTSSGDALFILTLFHPDHPTLLFALGEVEFALGHFLEARALYTSTYLFDNTHTDALERILFCCEKLEDFAAKEEMEQFITNSLK